MKLVFATNNKNKIEEVKAPRCRATLSRGKGNE